MKIFLSSNFTSIFDFSFEIIIIITTAIVTTRFVEPLYDALIDSFKNNSGRIGRIYKLYSRTIGRFIFLKKKKTHELLQREGWEYKVFKNGDEIKCCRSQILRLDQNIFKRIQGEIIRVSESNNSFSSFFKGHIKNKESDYLIWEENYKNEDGHFYISTHYSLKKHNKGDIPGISIHRRNGIIICCLSILSFSPTPHTSLKKLLANEEVFAEYLERLNIDVRDISAESNRILIGN